MRTIGFVGAGNMASAIINGIDKNSYKIIAYDIDTGKVSKIKDVMPANNINDLTIQSDIIFLCVKPQDFKTVLAEIKPFFSNDKLVVTIAAGITMNFIENSLVRGAKIVRVMPNTPLMLSCGASAICKNGNASEAEIAEICKIFADLGEIAVIEESQMNAITSVNGSSPAYVYLFVKAMLNSAAEQGIERETAFRLILKTIEGSCKMLRESGKTPDELIQMVSSKGGTTVRALDTLYEYNFEKAIDDAMKNCALRAEELSQ